MIADNKDPDAIASPIGKSVAGNNNEVRYAPGIRTVKMEMVLCMKEIEDRLHPQKYPLKQK